MSGDFVDCPLWAPCTVAHYIKETSDFSLLDEPLPYFDSDAVGTVEEHHWRTVDHASHCRGENGLLLMRDDDWLDGLAGINQNGTATSAWTTMEAYWVQNILAERCDAIGQTAKAALLRRSAEYKRIVREVAICTVRPSRSMRMSPPANTSRQTQTAKRRYRRKCR